MDTILYSNQLGCDPSEIIKFIAASGLFSLLLTSGQVIHFSPLDPVDFTAWLLSYGVQDIKCNYNCWNLSKAWYGQAWCWEIFQKSIENVKWFEVYIYLIYWSHFQKGVGFILERFCVLNKKSSFIIDKRGQF